MTARDHSTPPPRQPDAAPGGSVPPREGAIPALARVRVFVDGWVQGVGFRMNAAWQADRLGVGGWVRNLPDGRVEAVYEGNRDAVEGMLAWTRHGPPGARVADMDIHDEEPKGERGFSVR